MGYYQSTIEGCARPGNQALELDGYDIIMRVTLMQPPPTPWAIPCQEQLVELDTVEAIGAPLKYGQTYRVIVNDSVATTYTLPEPHLRGTFIAESPIDSATIAKAAAAPPQYQLYVVSGLPKGSSCSQFNGYEIRREESNRIDVVITHHQVADPLVACTEDYPIVETIVPLGSNLEPGVEYTVSGKLGTPSRRSSPVSLEREGGRHGRSRTVELGAFSISLAVADIEASRAFYEKFGFEVIGGDAAENWLILQNDGHTIGLFPGDVREEHPHVQPRM